MLIMPPTAPQHPRSSVAIVVPSRPHPVGVRPTGRHSHRGRCGRHRQRRDRVAVPRRPSGRLVHVLHPDPGRNTGRVLHARGRRRQAEQRPAVAVPRSTRTDHHRASAIAYRRSVRHSADVYGNNRRCRGGESNLRPCNTYYDGGADVYGNNRRCRGGESNLRPCNTY
jgi:hypothetical protein